MLMRLVEVLQAEITNGVIRVFYRKKERERERERGFTITAQRGSAVFLNFVEWEKLKV